MLQLAGVGPGVGQKLLVQRLHTHLRRSVDLAPSRARVLLVLRRRHKLCQVDLGAGSRSVGIAAGVARAGNVERRRGVARGAQVDACRLRRRPGRGKVLGARVDRLRGRGVRGPLPGWRRLRHEPRDRNGGPARLGKPVQHCLLVHPLVVRDLAGLVLAGLVLVLYETLVAARPVLGTAHALGGPALQTCQGASGLADVGTIEVIIMPAPRAASRPCQVAQMARRDGPGAHIARDGPTVPRQKRSRFRA